MLEGMQRAYDLLEQEIRRRNQTKVAYRQWVWETFKPEFWTSVGVTQNDLKVWLNENEEPHAKVAWEAAVDLPGGLRQQAQMAFELHAQREPESLKVQVTDKDEERTESAELKHATRDMRDALFNQIKLSEAILRAALF
jgi:hypothetical protein